MSQLLQNAITIGGTNDRIASSAAILRVDSPVDRGEAILGYLVNA